MGCASSGPLAKNLVNGAKDTAHNVVEMGEHAAHDVSAAAKDGLEHMKLAVDSAVSTAEHGFGTIIGKIEETLGHKKEEADKITTDVKEAVDAFESATTDAAHKVIDGATEEVSEAETILASEAEDTKEMVEAKQTENEELIPVTEDKLEVEDIEDIPEHGMGSTVKIDETKRHVEELVARLPTPASTPPPALKEEPPTSWEKAADEIINRPLYPSMRREAEHEPIIMEQEIDEKEDDYEKKFNRAEYIAKIKEFTE